MNGAYLIGVDLGGTSAKAVAVSRDGECLRRLQVDFEGSLVLGFGWAVREAVVRLESEMGSPSAGVGLSAPGLASADGRSIAFMPGRFPGLVGLDWSRYLGRKRVTVLNDAHAALLGEVWQGAARGVDNVILLTLGTGVGGAAMVDGQLLRGVSGKAGHLGHITVDADGPPDVTGTPGSLEDAIGNHTVGRRSNGRFRTTHELIRAHESGDPQATEIWLRSVHALAVGIVSLTNVLDPEVVIVGGGIARCGETLFRPLRESVLRFEWQVCGRNVRIVPAALGEYAGALGAARNRMNWVGCPPFE